MLILVCVLIYIHFLQWSMFTHTHEFQVDGESERGWKWGFGEGKVIRCDWTSTGDVQFILYTTHLGEKNWSADEDSYFGSAWQGELHPRYDLVANFTFVNEETDPVSVVLTLDYSQNATGKILMLIDGIIIAWLFVLVLRGIMERRARTKEASPKCDPPSPRD